MSIKQKKQLFMIEAINKELEIAGYSNTYEDVKFIEDWFHKFTMTTEQCESWKKWFIKTAIERKISYNESIAETEFKWFNLSYGLRIDDSKCKANE